jgi:hypothetical protein
MVSAAAQSNKPDQPDRRRELGSLRRQRDRFNLRDQTVPAPRHRLSVYSAKGAEPAIIAVSAVAGPAPVKIPTATTKTKAQVASPRSVAVEVPQPAVEHGGGC